MERTKVTEASVRGLGRKIEVLFLEIGSLRALIEDSLLTAEEARFLDEQIGKIEAGDTSEFVTLEPADGDAVCELRFTAGQGVSSKDCHHNPETE